MLERRPPHRPSARRRGARRRKSTPRPSRSSRSSKFAWFIVIVGVISSAALAIYGLWNGGFSSNAAWKELSAELKARGEPLTIEEVIPPDLPDDQNFFAAPVFAGLAEGSPDSPLLENAGQSFTGKSVEELLVAATQPDGSVDLTPIAEAFDGVDAEYLLPADRVRAGMRKARIDFSTLIEAAGIPGARFPIDYSSGVPALPHLSRLETLADWLAIDAIARIDTGNGAAATSDLLLIGRLANAISSEPFLESQQLRRQLFSLIAGCIRLGLQSAAFTDESLSQLVPMLENARLLTDFGWAVRGERARLNAIIDGELDNSAQAAAGFAESWLGAPLESMRSRERNLRRTAANAATQNFLDQLNGASGIAPSAILPPEGTTPPPRLVELAADAGKCAQVQTYVAQAALACALERHRIANGAYPDSLDELVPKYLPGIPVDPMTGRPLEYVHGPNDFTLTGAGWTVGKPWVWRS